MYALQKGQKVRFSFSNIIFMFLAVLLSATLPTIVHAQNQSKPKLVELSPAPKQSSEEALKIAKKLSPELFKVDKKYTNGFDDAKYYARFLNYNDSRFLIATARDTYFHCTKYGCPFILYKNVSKNQWQKISSFQGYKVIYDENSKNTKYPNIIVEGFSKKTGASITIYLWNGFNYQEAAK